MYASSISQPSSETPRAYVEKHLTATQRALGLDPPQPGTVEAAGDLAAGASGAWMIIESVPERVDVNVEVFGELDRLAADDAICGRDVTLSGHAIAQAARREPVEADPADGEGR